MNDGQRATARQMAACVHAYQAWHRGIFLAACFAPPSLTYAVLRGIREGLQPPKTRR